MIHPPDTLGDMHFKPTDRIEKPNYLDREWFKCGSVCTRQVKPVQTLDMCPPVPLFKMSLYCRVNQSEIKNNNKLYHENSHLETSPWSPHGSDEGPAVLFGVITLYSPQTLLSVVASCRKIKIHQSYRGALGSYIFLYIVIFSKNTENIDAQILLFIYGQPSRRVGLCQMSYMEHFFVLFSII